MATVHYVRGHGPRTIAHETNPNFPSPEFEVVRDLTNAGMPGWLLYEKIVIYECRDSVPEKLT